jgi:mono/diheme cytochrome c family protein
LATAFGTFYAPNITPDKANGIGAWSEADFRRALHEGRGPDGRYLYPVFPYPSFTRMADRDIADLYAYLMAQPAVSAPSKPQQARFPFGFRPLLALWRALFFRAGAEHDSPPPQNASGRGRYLVEAVAHCGECHSPRNWLGAVEYSRALAGNPAGPDGQKAPDITPDVATGIGKWTVEDIATLLKTGQTPEFDFVGSGMADVVRGTARLTDADRQAIAVYLKSLPPRRATGK